MAIDCSVAVPKDWVPSAQPCIPVTEVATLTSCKSGTVHSTWRCFAYEIICERGCQMEHDREATRWPLWRVGALSHQLARGSKNVICSGFFQLYLLGNALGVYCVDFQLYIHSLYLIVWFYVSFAIKSTIGSNAGNMNRRISIGAWIMTEHATAANTRFCVPKNEHE